MWFKCFLFVLCTRFEVLTVMTVKDFLPVQEFVPKGDWLHLDIAGVMGTTENLPYLAKGMTGRPTRTLVEFISSLVKGSA
jgi:Leucyl aminopeptidase